MKELTLQNHDLTTQLKGSMARELEWRYSLKRFILF